MPEKVDHAIPYNNVTSDSNKIRIWICTPLTVIHLTLSPVLITSDQLLFVCPRVTDTPTSLGQSFCGKVTHLRPHPFILVNFKDKQTPQFLSFTSQATNQCYCLVMDILSLNVSHLVELPSWRQKKSKPDLLRGSDVTSLLRIVLCAGRHQTPSKHPSSSLRKSPRK